jgi:undecaprenyl-phosphate 4-deoxy-4-formamido-L-arabinose transferase
MARDYPISIIVPAYNSAAILPELVASLQVVLKDGWPRSAESELIIVNDGSRDESWAVIRTLAEQHDWIRGVNLMRNYGQHNAILCGIRMAKHDVIVTMDDDLQHPPGEIHKLLDKLDEGFDMVYGTPQKEQHGLWRDFASRATKMALQGSMGAETARNVSAFRAFRTQIRNAFADYRSPFVSIDVLLTWGTTRFSYVLVRHDPRRAGVSNYTFRKLLSHAINMATGFSTLPLQLASLVGFTFTFFGIMMLIYVIVRYIAEGGSVPGFPFLASTIAIFSGAQLFALGIIGEYLARMHFQSMGRPSSVVREIVQSPANGEEKVK